MEDYVIFCLFVVSIVLIFYCFSSRNAQKFNQDKREHIRKGKNRNNPDPLDFNYKVSSVQPEVYYRSTLEWDNVVLLNKRSNLPGLPLVNPIKNIYGNIKESVKSKKFDKPKSEKHQFDPSDIQNSREYLLQHSSDPIVAASKIVQEKSSQSNSSTPLSGEQTPGQSTGLKSLLMPSVQLPGSGTAISFPSMPKLNLNNTPSITPLQGLGSSSTFASNFAQKTGSGSFNTPTGFKLDNKL